MEELRVALCASRGIFTVPFVLYAHAFKCMLNPFISSLQYLTSWILSLLLGPQGNTITLLIAPLGEPHIEKYGRSGEAPVPRSITWLEDAALQNPLPHLYPSRLRSPRKNTEAENRTRRTEDGKRTTCTVTVNPAIKVESADARANRHPQITRGMGPRETEKGKRGTSGDNGKSDRLHPRDASD